MSFPYCEYCGCTEINCLAQCPVTGLYFCNGKGMISQSHIIHFLRSTRSLKFVLPQANPFANTSLTCVLCGSDNIYQLGFLYSQDRTKVFIVCRSPCQFDEQLDPYQVDRDNFISFVSNGQITPYLVARPLESQYSKISPNRALAVIEATKQYFSFAENTPSNSKPIYRLPSAKVKYSNIQDYCSSLISFIKAESVALKAVTDFQRAHGSPVKVDWLSETRCIFKAPPIIYKATSLGSTVLVHHTGQMDKSRVVSRKNNFNIILDFKARPFFYGENELKLSPEGNLATYVRQEKAVKYFQKKFRNQFLTDVFLGNISVLEHSNNCVPIPLSEPRGIGLPSLNESQRSCIEMALRQRFSMIQGPPGTGKTTVIVAMAFSFVMAGISPVMICAQSNTAVDLATQRIALTGVRVVRVLSRNREDIEADIIDFSSKKFARERHSDYDRLYTSNDQKLHKKAVQYERDEIKSCQVVCATCGAAMGSRFDGMNFPVVIFDESGQCTDADLICAVVHASDRVILVGDHRQLGPVVLSRETTKARYDMSLLERLVVAGVKPAILRVQYRMHPAISEYPSEAFYGKMLMDGVTKAERTWMPTKSRMTIMVSNDYLNSQESSNERPSQFNDLNFPELNDMNKRDSGNIPKVISNNSWSQSSNMLKMEEAKNKQTTVVEKKIGPKISDMWPNPDYPIFFWNVQGEEVYADDGISYVNVIEGEKISQVIQYLVRCGVSLNDIGIITPYAGQQIHLIEALPSMCPSIDPEQFENLEIASVDAFQGREKDFIIFSCVRVNQNHEIGFLRDTRRLCVSLTRAKYGLIVIGNAETFTEETVWKNFLIHCQEKGVLTTGLSLDRLTPVTIINTSNNDQNNDPIVNSEINIDELATENGEIFF